MSKKPGLFSKKKTKKPVFFRKKKPVKINVRKNVKKTGLFSKKTRDFYHTKNPCFLGRKNP